MRARLELRGRARAGQYRLRPQQDGRFSIGYRHALLRRRQPIQPHCYFVFLAVCDRDFIAVVVRKAPMRVRQPVRVMVIRVLWMDVREGRLIGAQRQPHRGEPDNRGTQHCLQCRTFYPRARPFPRPRAFSPRRTLFPLAPYSPPASAPRAYSRARLSRLLPRRAPFPRPPALFAPPRV